jgi:hypothetical protein
MARVTGIHQARDLVRAEQRRAIYQNQMAAHRKLWARLRDLDGVVEGQGVGHQSGGGHDAGAVRLHDSAIHSGGEAEVIRIDDQTPHAIG